MIRKEAARTYTGCWKIDILYYYGTFRMIRKEATRTHAPKHAPTSLSRSRFSPRVASIQEKGKQRLGRADQAILFGHLQHTVHDKFVCSEQVRADEKKKNRKTDTAWGKAQLGQKTYPKKLSLSWGSEMAHQINEKDKKGFCALRDHLPLKLRR